MEQLIKELRILRAVMTEQRDLMRVCEEHLGELRDRVLLIERQITSCGEGKNENEEET